MPRQNRVQPDGAILVHPARGQFMGNRGILHGADGQIGAARWRHPHWITCVLSFKSRKRPLNAPGRYTELFFHDEAVACAAGHRPCAECRRADYNGFRAAWDIVFSAPASAADIDRVLHAARIDRSPRGQRRFRARLRDLPSGAFIRWEGQPHRVTEDALLPFFPDGYGVGVARPASGLVEVLTPEPMVAVMRAGWTPRC